jgi:hypothetical protein
VTEKVNEFGFGMSTERTPEEQAEHEKTCPSCIIRNTMDAYYKDCKTRGEEPDWKRVASAALTLLVGAAHLDADAQVKKDPSQHGKIDVTGSLFMELAAEIVANERRQQVIGDIRDFVSDLLKGDPKAANGMEELFRTAKVDPKADDLPEGATTNII